jgi:hypothetical protein
MSEPQDLPASLGDSSFSSSSSLPPGSLSAPSAGAATTPGSWNVQLDRAQVIAGELGLRAEQVRRTLALLDEGATLPFIARYRKEVTSGLDEVQIGSIQERGAYLTELVARKTAILTEIHKQGKLSPGLERRLIGTLSKTELEDSVPAVQAEAADAGNDR